MTARQVTAYLTMNEKTLYRLTQRRELPAFKMAGAWRFKREVIERWIDEQKELRRGPTNERGRTRRGLGGCGRFRVRVCNSSDQTRPAACSPLGYRKGYAIREQRKALLHGTSAHRIRHCSI